MAKLHGKDFAVYVAGVKVADATDCTLTVTQEIIPHAASHDDVDDGSWESHVRGARSWSVSVNFIEDSSNSFSLEDAIDLILNASSVQVEFSQATASTVYWFGTASAETTNANAPMGTVNGGITFRGNGTLSKATISAS